MKVLYSILVLGCGLAALPQIARGQENVYTFDSDLESLSSINGYWQWINRDNIPWLLPDGPDGFAVQYMPGEGDALYESQIDIQYGFDYEITYYISSEEARTTILKIQQLDLDGTALQDVETFESDPSTFEWVTVRGTFSVTGAPSRFGVYCQSGGINLVNQPFYGCAIDVITLTPHPAPTTTTEPEPTSSVPLPGDSIDFNFENSTQGWLLGTSNGASWQRLLYGSTVFGIGPPTGDYVLEVTPNGIFSGTVMATSPRLRVGDSGVMTARIEFYIAASNDYPAYLKLRKRISYTDFEEEIILNMDPFGDQLNMQWLTMAGTVDNLTPGEEFNLVLEGNLGISNELSRIFVSRLVLEGVSIMEYEETEIFDFSDGLVGWQAGSKDGGKWEVLSYADLPPGLSIPPPTSDYILMVNRFDIHSGVITIESPPIEILPESDKLLQIRLFIRGSQVYPVIFRLSLKSVDGVYDPLPFIDLSPQGDSNLQTWVSLRQLVPIPANPRDSHFQLVFEVDLGGDEDNLIAIDRFEVRTR